MAVKVIKDLHQYVKFIEDKCAVEYILYRGQPEDKPLLPKIARPETNLVEPVLEAEKFILEEFRKRSIPFFDRTPETDWDLLTLAQHHGLLTRLLDWTENPLAALWFAVEKPPIKNDEGEEQNGVVWVFKTSSGDQVKSKKKEDPFTGKKTKVFQPGHIEGRIIAQSGWFTVHKYVTSKTTGKSKFVYLENNKLYKKKLIKLLVPPNRFEAIRYQLDQCGVHMASLFPDLDGLCKYLVWCNTTLGDEGKSDKRKRLKK